MTPQTRPVYLETRGGTIAGLLDVQAGKRRRSPVLIGSPWGWDQVSSYRSRKRWAERLSAAGHTTLRFDWPATGDSAGMPEDADLVGSWLAALVGAAAWLRDEAGGAGVAVIGLGLGGLLAREAVARGAPIEQLVLWGAPPTGRALVREIELFSRMQPWSSKPRRGAGPSSASGLEAGGFVLSEETIEALRSLPREDRQGSAFPRRALLLDRDGVEVDSRLRAELEAAGTEVGVGPGSGWAEMVSHPERSRLSAAVVDIVEDWLAAGDRDSGALTSGRDPAKAEAADRLDLQLGDGASSERPWTLRQPFGRVFGVLAEPAARAPSGLCAVFFNAGAVRHIGPNRMWAETARRWAARGVPGLRVDFEGIGEADGDESRLTDVSEFYVPDFDDQVKAVLDSLQAQGIGDRFLLVGLCAGGYWSFRAAQRDARVERAVLLNAGALVWRAELLTDRDARKLGRVVRRRWWRKFVRGEISPAQLLTTARAILRKTGRLLRRLLSGARRPGDDRGPLAAELDRLPDGVGVTMAFSADEALEAALRAEGIPARLDRWPQVTWERLPGSDHTLRPLEAQHQAGLLLDEEFERAGSRA